MHNRINAALVGISGLQAMIATIGYERSDLSDFVFTLKFSNISVLVDIRDRAQSRRLGFSKSALASTLAEAGIGYLHMPELGDPKEGREAARRNDWATFRKIFGGVIASREAQAALSKLVELASKENICLMCFERDQLQCHRKIVADDLCARLQVKPMHLGVQAGVGRKAEIRRMRDHHQSAATSVQPVL